MGADETASATRWHNLEPMIKEKPPESCMESNV